MGLFSDKQVDAYKKRLEESTKELFGSIDDAIDTIRQAKIAHHKTTHLTLAQARTVMAEYENDLAKVEQDYEQGNITLADYARFRTAHKLNTMPWHERAKYDEGKALHTLLLQEEQQFVDTGIELMIEEKQPEQEEPKNNIVSLEEYRAKLNKKTRA